MPACSSGRAVLTASRAGEYSFEGKSLTGQEITSVFTAGLIDGLATGAADTDHDGRISIDDAQSRRRVHPAPRQHPDTAALALRQGRSPATATGF
jgi:hypothetical protein